MNSSTYTQQRSRIEHYFDRTAADAWARLTSTAPVSGIRATVRAGRDEIRSTLLDWLGPDLKGRRVLDAGCGTGALAVEAARRGAEVVAIDLSPTLVQLARERLPEDLVNAAHGGRIDFRSGDMLDSALGHFDHVVGMDSFIHYRRADLLMVIEALADRTHGSMMFTFAPKTPLLATMITVGRLFPQRDRAPFIEPVAESKLRGLVGSSPQLGGWHARRSHRVSKGFYNSHALELVRS